MSAIERGTMVILRCYLFLKDDIDDYLRELFL